MAYAMEHLLLPKQSDVQPRMWEREREGRERDTAGERSIPTDPANHAASGTVLPVEPAPQPASAASPGLFLLVSEASALCKIFDEHVARCSNLKTKFKERSTAGQDENNRELTR